jgi:DNA adenine methylase
MNALIKYHGGKSRLADWIVSYMPEHRCYVEPFGGGGSVLLRKRSAQSEIYNDLDGDVVNLFRVIRHRGDELAMATFCTPFSRDEMNAAYEYTEDDLERARRLLVRAHMALKTTSIRKKSSFRASINSKDYCSQFYTWYRLPETIIAVRNRLAKVGIENTDAFTLFDRYDLPETLWYLDPPYMTHTRSQSSNSRAYHTEMTDDDHTRLLRRVQRLQGMVMISGYRTSLYETMLADWQMVTKKTRDDNNNQREECLWMNWHGGRQINMF